MKDKITIKDSILRMKKRWRTYDQIGLEVKKTRTISYNMNSYETIARRIRELVEEGKMERKMRRFKFSNGEIKQFAVFRKIK